MTSDAEIFVGIRNLVDIRKELLTASRDTLKVMRKHDDYKRLRTEKLQHIVRLYRILTELAALNRKLKHALPKVAFEDDATLPTTSTGEKTVAIGKPTAKSKLDVLEEELDAIESRLGALG